MEVLKILAISALISLSSNFTEGLKMFEQEKYDKAIEYLSVVIENKDEQRFKEIALFYRAQAFYAKGEIEKARADIIELIKLNPSGEYATAARKIYIEWGGKPSDLSPKYSPKEVWKKFAEFIVKKDLESAKKLGSERWNNFIEKLFEYLQHDMSMFLGVFLPLFPPKEIFSEHNEAKTAKLIYDFPAEGNVEADLGYLMVIEFVLDKEKNCWLIDNWSGIIGEEMTKMVEDFADIKENVIERGDLPPQKIIKSNLEKLKMIGLALRMYSQENNELFPPTLEDLISGEYLEDENIIFWTDENSDKKIKFVYRSGLTENDDISKIVAAAPLSTNGKREVLFLDGHVEVLKDEVFKEQVLQQGWNFPGLIKKDDIPPEKQEEIRNLVRKLGDNDSKVRKEAKKQLSELGIEAFPILEEFIDDPDPEIKISVQELLKSE